MLWLHPIEYSELCHAIRSMFANKIPDEGIVLYKNHLYRYTYSGKTHRIVCLDKIEIEGNQDIIEQAVEVYNVKRKAKKILQTFKI